MKLITTISLLVLLVLASAAQAAPKKVTWERVKVSTYGWPGDGPYQGLAGCGYRAIGGKDAGRRSPCYLNPRQPVMAHRTLPLGTLLRVCTEGPSKGTCSGARVWDRCGPGCDANGVWGDQSWGLQKRLGLGYTTTYVWVARLS